MSYSDSFPSVSPTWQCNFAANGGRIDPRATFSRASSAFVADGSKHLSSENLLLQSSDFDTTWSPQALKSITGGQTDPSGGTDGFTLVENTATLFHRITQPVTATGELAFTVYAKRTSGTRYLNLTINETGAQHSAALATFDLAGGATHTANGSSSGLTNLSATQTASGNGYYKCVFKATATTTTSVNISLSDVATPVSNNYGLVLYTGDGTSSIDVAFASLSTTGATDYNATTTQIHREYASSLVSKANNTGRFEVGTDGQSAGTSLGILVEQQSSNLIPNSSAISSWATKGNVTITDSAAVGPDGTLSASLVRPTGATSLQHYIRENITTVASSSYTFSAYVKAAGYTKLLLVGEQTAHPYTDYANATFTLTGAGSVTTSAGSATITALSDGWYRVTATGTAATTGSYALISVLNDAGDLVYTSDSYSGIIITGVQFELGSFASSLIATSGATATRAADSLSVTDASIFNGGEHSVYWEGSFNGSIIDPRMFSLSDGTNDNRLVVDYNDGNTPRIRGWADGTLHVSESATGQTLPAGSSKIVGTLKTNESRLAINGTQYASDTTGIVVGTMDRMAIGSEHSGGNVLNGHVKRVAYYSTALSQTEIETLTAS